MTYSLDYAQYTISYRTAKPVQRGEELTIFYGHSVRFSNTSDGAERQPDILDDESQSVHDEWGGLGRLGPIETSSETSSTREENLSPGGAARAAKLAALKALTPEEPAERDNEIIAPTDPDFRWKKVTELVDPEDADLTLSESRRKPICSAPKLTPLSSQLRAMQSTSPPRSRRRSSSSCGSTPAASSTSSLT